ncbi:alpha-ketoacid dehydrogenase subunit beta [Falsiroseomonas stagni]|uniref:Pyruvate dehydrogenase E1 component beta subunit n=1 Tax=Falsiroseomonas stagni DSM 19981 TaxID=1123062 RepID=A0A1I4CEY0_9PROT|nr:transketolase C-terminal domain-containing protein [Falsiroseomonas stagni]SFK78706.1 pyruvate dehydrogenase E1 component beta subunit [Falsiroseomonas stagni DSM 19981]
MAQVTLVEAARLAALQEMRRDPTVWVLGEDVARGGLFGQYRGFLDEFGADRIVSTPISESMIMGGGLGAALVGTRPIIEMRIFDFVMCAMDELVNQVAKVRYMFGGQAKPAVVVRMPHGIWRNSAAQHSQTLESWFTHIPGVIVAVPATPADTAGLLVSAIRSDDPVLFFDPKNLFPLTGEVPAVIDPIPFGKARLARAGKDLTIVTWSAIVPQVEEAGAMLAERGIEAEILDLRTLWPWDEEAVAASLHRTGRLLVAHEAVTVGGFGGEVVARMVERLGPAAIKAVARVGQPRVPVPFAPPLEDALKPDTAKIVAAAEALMRR